MKMELITKKHNGLDEEAMVIIAKDDTELEDGELGMEFCRVK